MAKANVFFSQQTSSNLPDPLTPFDQPSDREHDNQVPSARENLTVKGAQALLQGDKSGLRYFEIALRLDPYDSTLYFEQGLSLLEYGSEHLDKSILLLALRRLKKGLVLNPTHTTSKLAACEAMYQLGTLLSDTSFFYQAKEACLAICLETLSDEVACDLHAMLGSILFKLAQKSGEPTDFYQAITSFERALSLNNKLELSFYSQLIESYLKLFELNSDSSLLAKSLNYCTQAITIHPDSGSLYYYLAKGLSFQHDLSHNEDHASRSSCFFLKSLQLSPFTPAVYLDAMQHEIDSFSIHQNPSYLAGACNLYEKGCKHLDEAQILIPVYVEALTLLGLHKGSLATIKSAQKLIESVCDEEKINFVDYSKALGICYSAGGHYFQDCDLLYQGVEHFQIALSVNRSRQDLWHLMAKTYAHAFKIESDDIDFETAVKFYKKTLQFSSSSTLHFEYASLLLTCFDVFGEEPILKEACIYFSSALNKQSNANYSHPTWLFEYAKALDLTSDFDDNENNLVLSIKLLKEVYALDSNFSGLFHQLALSYHHLGSLVLDQKLIERSLHYFKLGNLKDKENSQLLLDWGAALMSCVETLNTMHLVNSFLKEAHEKIINAIALGGMQGYYLLACLYSYKGELDSALFYLEKAHQFDALPSINELEDEVFLEPLLQSDSLHLFLDHISWKNAE